MKISIKFNARTILLLVDVALLLTSFIGAIVSNNVYTYPLDFFAVYIVLSVFALLVLVAEFLHLSKWSWLDDLLLFLAIASIGIMMGLLIYSRAYAYGMTSFTKAESDNPLLVESYKTGLFALIAYGVSGLLMIVTCFFGEKKAEKTAD